MINTFRNLESESIIEEQQIILEKGRFLWENFYQKLRLSNNPEEFISAMTGMTPIQLSERFQRYQNTPWYDDVEHDLNELLTRGDDDDEDEEDFDNDFLPPPRWETPPIQDSPIDAHNLSWMRLVQNFDNQFYKIYHKTIYKTIYHKTIYNKTIYNMKQQKKKNGKKWEII